jgi:putative FmdB family regulatory protein
MPIYEYQCLKCSAQVETMQKVTDKPLKKCKRCGGKLEKQWSLSGFQFKGDGWYVTDYTGRKEEAKEETKAAESKSSEHKEKKSESKKETKKETKKTKKETAKPSA